MLRKKFKNLTEEDKEYIRYVYYQNMSHVEKTDILSKKFGIADRTVRNWWARLDLSDIATGLPSQLQKALSRTVDRDTKVLLVSTAQNKTSVNKGFLNSLENYKDFITNILGKKTEILVIPSKYRNPTSNVENEKSKTDDWWDDSLAEYLIYGKVNFGDTTISADSRISPTAKSPLDGYEILASDGHLILGHSKIHFKTLPRFRDSPLRVMSTTGYMTSKNYSKSKAGDVAYENHSYGFVIVELKDDDTCYIPRNVKVKADGSFIDIIYNASKDGVVEAESSLGFIFGDLHARQVNEEFLQVSKNIAKRLKPQKVVIHDALDGATVNPHESKDMFAQRQKIVQGKHLVEEEVEECLDILNDIREDVGGELFVVESNHDLFMDRYINDFQWKKDLHNSPAYLRYAYIQQTVDLEIFGNIFGYLIHERFLDSVKYVKMGDSLFISDYQCGQHADFGANGSKGSTKGFGRMNLKLIGGHSHCMPGGYKVQTLDKGWKEIRGLVVGDTILSYNPETKTNEWNVIEETYEKDYNDIMLRIKGNGFEQSFTKEHMLMMRNGDYIPAHEAILTRSSSELLLSAKAVENIGVSVPEKIIRQIVAIAADGSHDKYRMRFRFKKERKIDRIKELFGEDLIVHDYTDVFSGYISTRSESYKNILKYKPYLAQNKRLSNEVLRWDSESLEVLVDELKYWDGTYKTENNGNQWSSSVLSEANIVMSALNRLGYSCSLNQRVRIEGGNVSHVVTWCSDRDVVRNSSNLAHSPRINGWGLTTTQESCKVYCVSVKNKCFWVRSDKTGDVSLTGNSPMLYNNVTTVGVTCNIKQWYNRKGLSSWAYAHSVVHSNGKNQLLVFDDKDYSLTGLL